MRVRERERERYIRESEREKYIEIDLFRKKDIYIYIYKTEKSYTTFLVCQKESVCACQ